LTRWLAVANRAVAVGVIGLGVAIGGFALFMGFFGWINSGAKAGLGILLVAGSFGLAFAAAGWCFLVIARAHAAGSPSRWWLQLILPMAAWVFFGLAAMVTSLTERFIR